MKKILISYFFRRNNNFHVERPFGMEFIDGFKIYVHAVPVPINLINYGETN